MVLVFVESAADELSQQAVGFARGLGDSVEVVTIEGGYAPAGWARALSSRDASVLVGPGTDRGNQALAHVAAILDQPFAANCT